MFTGRTKLCHFRAAFAHLDRETKVLHMDLLSTGSSTNARGTHICFAPRPCHQFKRFRILCIFTFALNTVNHQQIISCHFFAPLYFFYPKMSGSTLSSPKFVLMGFLPGSLQNLQMLDAPSKIFCRCSQQIFDG